MALTNTATADEFGRAISGGVASSGTYAQSVYEDRGQPETSAVSWGAILAGASAAAALSLILLILGTGLGLSSLSPWSHDGVSAKTFGVSTIVWLTVTQLLASGMGGYLAGRLRTKWSAAHADEVYFRDTAHGFLAWAIASLATAALLTSVIGSIVSGGVQAGASVAGGLVTTAATAVTGVASTANNSEIAKAGKGNGAAGSSDGPMAYFIDSLFRKDMNASNSSSGSEPDLAGSSLQVSRIFMNSMATGALPADDLQYAGQLVAQRTGLSQQDAEKRVTDIYTRVQTQIRNAETTAREAADQARKASVYAVLWLFVSLLIGAFVASLAATFGGKQRDA